MPKTMIDIVAFIAGLISICMCITAALFLFLLSWLAILITSCLLAVVGGIATIGSRIMDLGNIMSKTRKQSAIT